MHQPRCHNVPVLLNSVRTVVVASGLALAVSAPAQADPLLSGYGGPGSNDQGLLGATLLPGGGGGGGGEPVAIRATAATIQSAPVLTQTPSPVVSDGSRPSTAGARPVATGSGRPDRGARSAGSARRDGGSRSGAASTASGSTAEPSAPKPAEPPASPRVSLVRAPAAATTAGGLPLAGSDLLIALVVAAGLGLAGLASSRLAGEQRNA